VDRVAKTVVVAAAWGLVEEEEVALEVDSAAHDARPSAANVEDANSTLVTNSSKIWC
jgi:hypothetical protein